MTKREAAERNVNSEGASYETNGVECRNCPFFEKSDCKYLDEAYCVAFCKQWLADNPVDEWQELITASFRLSENPSMPDSLRNKAGALSAALDFHCKRQPEKKEVSHEEIMTKWWRFKDNSFDDWYRVIQYDKMDGKYTLASKEGFVEYPKSWFTNRESATIPPEAV